MTYRRSFAALACSALLLLFTGCDDPSAVGLDVGDDELEGGVPASSQAAATNLATFTEAPATANVNVNLDWRVLAGSVDDPLTGRIAAEGYVDVRSTQLTDGILNAAPSELTAALVLERELVHGDTTQAVTYDLFDLAEEADITGATADESFLADPNPIAGSPFSYTPEEDTLAVFELPQSWVDEHADVLRDTTDGGDVFESNFNGFKLVATSGNAVVGFDPGSSFLRLSGPSDEADTERDTVSFLVNRSFSHIERQSPPSVPPSDRLVLVDGLGIGLTFDVDFEGAPLDTLKNASVNRAELIVPVDTLGLQENLPPNFARPYENVRFRITANTTSNVPSCQFIPGVVPVEGSDDDDDAPLLCEVAVLLGAAPGSAFVPNGTAQPLMQQSLLRGSLYDNYRVHIATNPPSPQNFTGLNAQRVRFGQPSTLPILIPTTDAPDLDPPRLTYTVTPL